MSLTIVAAVGGDGAIGFQGHIPWRIPEDMKHFKRVTMGHAIIMGRQTWDEIGRPLPGRRNLVVSRNPALVLEGAEVCASVEDAVARVEDPYVIGGAQIYRIVLPLATRLILTEIHRIVPADTYFPPFDRSQWHETSRVAGQTEGVEFVTYDLT